MKPYYSFLLSATGSFGLIGAGAFLVIEHWLTWGYLEFEPLGHETYGAIMLLGGILLGGLAGSLPRQSGQEGQQ